MAEALNLTPLAFFACLIAYVLGVGEPVGYKRFLRLAGLVGLDLCLMFWGLAFLQRPGGTAMAAGGHWTAPLDDFFLTAGLQSALGTTAAGFVCFGLSFVPFFILVRDINKK